ncbi:glycosyltransferase [uncultured Flavobacterium sp.]|uniref:glycosyltransferase family 2 protein n=1 Tax=uncultured Flavobacterium sp. TaxID=165435 RepID=UPI003081205D
MISIVIRNKNEGKALESTLSILTKLYSEDFEEIILVDNNSTDNSLEIAKKYNCKIINIDNFSYGRAINLGIEASVSKYVLLLSSHSIPIGKSFFKNTLEELHKNDNIAGVRYINSIENYNRAIENNFKIKNPLKEGLLAACCIINKEVWKDNKFDEDLIAIEDKEWNDRVMKKGFEVLDLNETFIYFISRDQKASLKKYKIETIASQKMANQKPLKLTRIIGSFFYRIMVRNTQKYFKSVRYEFEVLKTNLEIREKLKK